MTILKNALEKADKDGKLNGEGIRAAFETFKDLDVGFGAAPMTWSATDHRPTSIVNLYQIKGGKFVLLKQLDLKAKYPNDWTKWIGYRFQISDFKFQIEKAIWHLKLES